MGCFLGRQQRAETEPLLQGRLGLANFRNGRDEANSTRDRRCIKWTVKGMAWTLGIWDPSGCGVMLSFLMALISLFQLAYDLFVVCGCPGFDCGYLQKHGNHQKQKPFRKTSNTMYTLASMGGFFSFTLLLICLLLVKRRRKLYDYKALVPPDVLDHDLSNRHLNVMSGTVALTVVLFSGSVGLFYYIVHSEPENTYFYWLVTGVASQFLSQWAAIVACHLFAICCCSMGTLADDTVRRIKESITCTGGPAAEHASPQAEQASPQAEHASPQTQQASPQTEQGPSPSKEGRSPTEPASPQTEQGPSPSKEGRSPTEPASPQTEQGPSPSKEGRSPTEPASPQTEQGPSPSKEGRSPTEPASPQTGHGPSPSKRGRSSTEPASPQTEQGPSPSKEGRSLTEPASPQTGQRPSSSKRGRSPTEPASPQTGQGPSPSKRGRSPTEPASPQTEQGPQTSEQGADARHSLDMAIRYHEELCSIVSDTVLAFCPWFVLHWLMYGSTSLLAIVELSEEIAFHTHIVSLVYIGCFTVTHMTLFFMPCCCAAYITDSCGGIHARINRTTSEAWPEGHPFRDRLHLTMFTAYAKDRQCVFKIGRVTFTSTLAWISFLLGFTGLLFHFF